MTPEFAVDRGVVLRDVWRERRLTTVETPDTHYAKSGDVSIAYQVMGSGPFDVVWVQGFVSSVELAWQQPTLAAFIRRLARSCRLIRFDKRGTGMSDRVGVAPLETRMDDVRAVMDAAGSARAALLGSSEGGPLSLLFAASYPERTRALILWSSFPRVAWAPDVPWGQSEQELQDELDQIQRTWNDLELMVELVEASAPDIDRQSKLALASAWRQSASPRDVEALERMNNEIDVRDVLPGYLCTDPRDEPRRGASGHRRRIPLPRRTHRGRASRAVPRRRPHDRLR